MIFLLSFFIFAQAQTKTSASAPKPVSTNKYEAVLQCQSRVAYFMENTKGKKTAQKPGHFQAPLAQILAVHVGDSKIPWVSVYPQHGIHHGKIKNNFVKVVTDKETYFEVSDSRSKKTPQNIYCRIQ